jgi:hypothetical protein
VLFLEADPTEAAGRQIADQAGDELMNKVVTHVA